MANEGGSPDVRHPSPQATADVRVAIESHLRRGSTEAELRRALRALARDARARSLRAEELIVALKDLLYSLPDVRAIADRGERDAVVARLVSLCIDVYYAAD